MKVILTNYGHRYINELARQHPLEQLMQDVEGAILLDLLTGLSAPGREDALFMELRQRGLVENVSDQVSAEEIALRYRRNPLEHIEKVIFEFTTLCNFNCRHCYNAGADRILEKDIPLLKSAADALMHMGIRRFDFVGGEVSRYGLGWLELARHMNGPGCAVVLFTNGWWLGKNDFEAAGCFYLDEAAYLDDLRQNGVTHIAFSLDGPEAVHDYSRRQPGLFARIIQGIERVKKAGLLPRVSLLLREDREMETFAKLLAELAVRIYDLPLTLSAYEKAQQLLEDRYNTISSFIDIGNGAQTQGSTFRLDDLPLHQLPCKGFYRPSPSLTIKANGEVSTCRIANAGEGYGNIHDQEVVAILNRMQEQFVFQLHAQRRLETYLPYVDRQIFGESFGHLCTLRAILTLLARKIEESQITLDDAPALRRINLEVAHYTGHNLTV